MTRFKRFTDLTVENIPETAKLVVVTGPNGSGKSALFEALNVYRRSGVFGLTNDPSYFTKSGFEPERVYDQVSVEFHDADLKLRPEQRSKAIWVRSAFRHQADVNVTSLARMDSQLKDAGLSKLTDIEGYVSDNYTRIASGTLDVFYNQDNRGRSAGDLTDELIAPLQEAVSNVFDDLKLEAITAPMDQASFFFSKGASKAFHYKNLSAGERAAFDLLLDMFVRVRTFDNTVFCIDEPEVHLGSRVQARLIEELFRLTPDNCQLWIATHSPGAMKAAMNLYHTEKSKVSFLDTYDLDFDSPQVMSPVQPTNTFWRRSLEIALDDLASLVAPDQLVLCEGSGVDGFDAKVYSTIFKPNMPGIEFISMGNSHEVKKDSQGIAAAIQVVAPGTKVIQVVDRDEHTDTEIGTLQANAVRVLSLRNIESYLLSDDAIVALCNNCKKPDASSLAIAHRDELLRDSVKQGYPDDDMKKILGPFKNYLCRELGIKRSGSTAHIFLYEIMAPLITPDLEIYARLNRDIFGG